MYKKVFGFSQKPFSVTPDPTFFYPSQSHREALASLRYGIRERMGFMVLTGEVGAGKTFLIRSLLKELGDDVKRALILNPILEADELFAAILEDLEVPFDKEASFVSQLAAFNEYLLKEHEAGNLVVVLIDESQDLSTDALERLRLLSNLETETAKLLQIVLVGQPELNDLLALPVLRQLDQRVTLRHHLEPFTSEETPEYIQHRLNVAANGEPKVSFDSAAARKIHRASGGIPRVVGLLCEHALNAAFLDEQRVVTAKIAKEAVAKGRNRAHSTRPMRLPAASGIRRWASAAAGAVCLAAALALFATTFLWSGARATEEVAERSDWNSARESRVVTALPEAAPMEPAGSDSPTQFAGALDVALEREPLSVENPPADAATTDNDLTVEPVETETEDSVWGEEVEDTAEAPEEIGEGLVPEIPEVSESEPWEEALESSLEPAPIPRGAPVLQTAHVSSPVEVCPAPEGEPSLALHPVPVTVAQEQPGTRFGIQVASLQSLDRAQRLANEVKQFGPVFLVPWRSERAGEWIRVVLGAYPNRSVGEEALRLLAKETWAADGRIIENRWWRQVPSVERNEVFALAGE